MTSRGLLSQGRVIVQPAPVETQWSRIAAATAAQQIGDLHLLA